MVPGVQLEDIVNSICQILHYYFQQHHDENFRHLC